MTWGTPRGDTEHRDGIREGMERSQGCHRVVPQGGTGQGPKSATGVLEGDTQRCHRDNIRGGMRVPKVLCGLRGGTKGAIRASSVSHADTG